MNRYLFLISTALCVLCASCSDETTTSNVPKSLCGNGQLDESEICDGSEFKADITVTCPENQIPAETKYCTSTCEIDLQKSCVAPTCGDGKLNEATEDCDGEIFKTTVACPEGTKPADKFVC